MPTMREFGEFPMICAECCQSMRPLEPAYTSRDRRVVCEYCAPYLRSDFERLKREMKERVLNHG